MFEICLRSQKWEFDVEEFWYTSFDVTFQQNRILENGNILSIGLRIAATSKFSAMEIAQKLGSGLKLCDASVESKISANFAKKKLFDLQMKIVCRTSKFPNRAKLLSVQNLLEGLLMRC